jgi:hypothetical protein
MAQTIYDLLTGVKIDDATVSQLDDATGRTFVDVQTVDFWQGILTLSHVLKGARTYPHGMAIPEASTIASVTVNPEDSQDLQPTGSEVWQVIGLQVQAQAGTPSVEVRLSDGSTTCIMHTANSSTTTSSFFPFEAPFNITNSLYIQAYNGDATNAVQVNLAYHKVSL